MRADALIPPMIIEAAVHDRTLTDHVFYFKKLFFVGNRHALVIDFRADSDAQAKRFE